MGVNVPPGGAGRGEAAQGGSDADHGAFFQLRAVELEAGAPDVYMHPDDAQGMGIHAGDRVLVRPAGEQRAVAGIVHLARSLIRKGVLGASMDLMERLGCPSGTRVHAAATTRPRSVDWIRRKLDGKTLSEEQIKEVIRDISEHRLSHIELTAWAVSTYVHDMDMDEIVACVHAMVDNGDTVRFRRGPVLDVHSIGGVPGNKYAPLCVSIAAANGLLVPKSSSRAISSACGTADFMEVLCPVDLTARQIEEIGDTVGGALAWGGGVNLAPADDEIIRVEYPLSIDPRSQLLASVMAKKLAVGARHTVIDIPVGPQNKVQTEEEARRLARDFIEVGERVGMQVKVAITNGSQPIGRAIGPVLEAREALQVLEGADHPLSLIEKACTLAGMLLELGGAVEHGQGRERALETLRSGRALTKFKEIVAAQGGDPDVRSSDLEPGPHSVDVHAPRDGFVEAIDNRALTQIARASGSPRDKGAGLFLHQKKGRKVVAGDPIYTVYAEHPHRLREAVSLANTLKPMRIEGMVVDELVG